MQEAALEHWKQMALAEYGKGDGEGEQGDFGWNGPFPEILELCQMVVMSKYQVWPEPGGYFDQPEWFREDFKTYMKGYVWSLAAYAPALDEPKGQENLYDIPDFASLG